MDRNGNAAGSSRQTQDHYNRNAGCGCNPSKRKLYDLLGTDELTMELTQEQLLKEIGFLHLQVLQLNYQLEAKQKEIDELKSNTGQTGENAN